MINRELYLDYMNEYLENMTSEMMSYVESKANDTYYYRDHLQIPYVRPILEKAENRGKIIKFTADFINTHSDKLTTTGPVKSFTFADKETSFLYELFGLTKADILDFSNKMFKETYGGTALFHIIREAPHKILLISIAIEAIQKNYEDVLECCKYLMAFCEYPLMYRTFWKLGVQEDIMNYTMEHLPNKFKVKVWKLENLLALLKYDMNSVFKLCHDRLKTGLDYQYIDFVYRCRNQIKATFKKIRGEYQKNWLKNSTHHSLNSKNDDGTLADTEGHTTNISNLVENIYIKIISNGVNLTIAKVVADGNQVDKDNTIAFLNQIYGSKENELYKYIESIITSYMSRNPTNTSVNSGEFLRFGLTLYRSIGTSKDPIYQEIRRILNNWMFEIIKINNYYQNKGTVINYTRAIFNYMIIMIQST